MDIFLSTAALHLAPGITEDIAVDSPCQPSLAAAASPRQPSPAPSTAAASPCQPSPAPTAAAAHPRQPCPDAAESPRQPSPATAANDESADDAMEFLVSSIVDDLVPTMMSADMGVAVRESERQLRLELRGAMWDMARQLRNTRFLASDAGRHSSYSDYSLLVLRLILTFSDRHLHDGGPRA